MGIEEGCMHVCSLKRIYFVSLLNPKCWEKNLCGILLLIEMKISSVSLGEFHVEMIGNELHICMRMYDNAEQVVWIISATLTIVIRAKSSPLANIVSDRQAKGKGDPIYICQDSYWDLISPIDFLGWKAISWCFSPESPCSTSWGHWTVWEIPFIPLLTWLSRKPYSEISFRMWKSVTTVITANSYTKLRN